MTLFAQQTRPKSFRLLVSISGALCASSLAGCAGQVTSVVAAPNPVAVSLWSGFEDHPGAYSTKATALNATAFLDPPPALTSSQAKADLEAFTASRSLQGSSRWAQAAADNEIETPKAPFKAFACALKAEIDPNETPVLTLLLGRILGEVQLAQHDLKTRTFRARPFVDTPAPICIAPEPWLAKSSAYPSGHSATGWTWALVLSSLAPDRREAVLKRGLDYGDSRAICGVHFPSDVDAGRVLGGGLFASLGENPDFRRDLDIARGELAKARLGKPEPAGCGAERL